LALTVDYDERIDELFIYDTGTWQFVYSCPIASYKPSPPRLLWSPDGAYIALYTFSSSLSPLLILEVKTGEIIELVQDAIAVGWSDSFPVEWP
jgi:hypothetical protein